MPKNPGTARPHSYQNPVDTAMNELFPRSVIALRVATASMALLASPYMTDILTFRLEIYNVFDHRLISGIWGPFIR